MSDINLRMERLALLIRQMVGQTSELLNQIEKQLHTNKEIYNSLLDINKAAALHIHELYYKYNSDSK